jgi:hypothetical protein
MQTNKPTKKRQEFSQKRKKKTVDFHGVFISSGLRTLF